MTDVHIITVGYPQIKEENGEHIIVKKIKDYTIKKDSKSIITHIDSAINLFDFNIILIKNPALVYPYYEMISNIGKYNGVIAMGINFSFKEKLFNSFFLEKLSKLNQEKIHAVDEYEDSVSKFSEYYFLKIGKYVQCTRNIGNNIEFSADHWLGNFFNKYKKSFRYEAVIDRSAYLKSIEPAIKYIYTKSGQIPPDLFVPYAHNPGNLIVGAIITADDTKLILHPIFTGDVPDKFFRGFIDTIKQNMLNIRNTTQNIPEWTSETFPEWRYKMNEKLREYVSLKQEVDKWTGLYYETNSNLVKLVKDALERLGFSVSDVSGQKESKDLIITSEKNEYLVEVKGLTSSADKDDISNFIANNPKRRLIFIVNHYRFESPQTRQDQKTYPPYTAAALKTININLSKKSIENFYVITTIDLANWLKEELKPEKVIGKMEENTKKLLEGRS